MGIIGFLLDHLVYVAVAVGLIWAMFFRSSPLERPPNRMPDFGGGGLPWPGLPEFRREPQREPRPVRRREPDPAERREATRPARGASRTDPDPAQAEPPFAVPPPAAPPRQASPSAPSGMLPAPGRYAPARPPEASSAPSAAAPASPVSPLLPAASGADSDPEEAVAGAEDLRRAFLWAEILGPPRARRPFRFR